MGFLAAAAPVLSLVGTAVGVGGAINQGNAEAATANYQAQVAKNNAVIASQYRENAIQTGEVQAYNQGLANRQKAAAVTAGIAGSGLDVNTGSAAKVREGEEETGYTDVETVRQQAALKAYGYGVEGSNYTAQAGLDTAQAGFAQEAGFMKAGGLLLSGASAVSPKFQSLFDSANENTGAAWSSPQTYYAYGGTGGPGA